MTELNINLGELFQPDTEDECYIVLTDVDGHQTCNIKFRFGLDFDEFKNRLKIAIDKAVSLL